MYAIAIGAMLSLSQVSLPPLGTNLAPIAQGATQTAFTDFMHAATPWAKEGDTWTATVFSKSGHIPPGEYRADWEGRGRLVGVDGATLVESGAGSAVLSLTKTEGSVTLRVEGGQPDRFKLFGAGFGPEYGPFHPVFAQRMSLYRGLRFADWVGTAGSQEKSWSDRTPPGTPTYFGGKVPWEVAIDLASAKTTTLWVTLPEGADESYVTGLAHLVRDRLKTYLPIVVELGDELWRDKTSDQAIVAAKRAAEVTAQFAIETGSPERVVRVLSVPFEDEGLARAMLGAEGVKGRFQAMATAPFFGSSVSDAGNIGRIKEDEYDAVIEILSEDAEKVAAPRLHVFGEIAKENGLKLLAYSGGLRMTAPKEAPELQGFVTRAASDTRIMEAYDLFFKAWARAGGGLFMHMRDTGPPREDGAYPALDYQAQDTLDAPRHQALVRYGLFPER
ncbi:MAG: hypothetical protein KIT11_05185 [Fimbriimonadaceae bacterium]|nr:hypothetical protein [Fimbriimonadaceae bacterium]QYK56713.1 MAG: hypothetical protein KF733_04335 [Fimbriimonadaceae bacterium]